MFDNEFEFYEDYDKLEMELFNLVDQEKIKIQGAPLYLWKFDLEATKLTNDSIPDDGLNLNDLYGEALPAGMVFLGPLGPIKGSYLEPTWTQDLKAFGIVEPEEINIRFNKQEIVDLLGRPPIIGDVLRSFHHKFYIVEDSYVSEETCLWEYIHINIIARKVDFGSLALPGIECLPRFSQV
jgi:hypothetical protein